MSRIGGIDEAAAFEALDHGVAAVEHGVAALADAPADHLLDAVAAARRDHGAHLHALVEAVADAQRARRLDDGVPEPVVRFAHRDGDGDGEAALAGASEGAVADDARGHVDVGVRQDDDVVLGAGLALHALAVRRGRRVDVAGDGRASRRS